MVERWVLPVWLFLRYVEAPFRGALQPPHDPSRRSCQFAGDSDQCTVNQLDGASGPIGVSPGTTMPVFLICEPDGYEVGSARWDRGLLREIDALNEYPRFLGAAYSPVVTKLR